MKITFPCSRCGKTLKARRNAAGQTRKCPVCADPGEMPRAGLRRDVVDAEVVDAEIVDAEILRGGSVEPRWAPAVNPYADLDDAGAYGLADPGPSAHSGPETEARRPCPMCGETILASAVKCRFCGEVFDAVLKKGKGRKSGKRPSRAAAARIPALRATSASASSCWSWGSC